MVGPVRDNGNEEREGKHAGTAHETDPRCKYHPSLAMTEEAVLRRQDGELILRRVNPAAADSAHEKVQHMSWPWNSHCSSRAAARIPAQNKKPDGCNDPPGSRVCSGCWVSELSGAQSVTRFGWPNGLQVSSGAVVRGLTQTDHYRYSQIPRSSVCGDTVKTFAEQVMPAQPQRYFSVVEVCLPTTTSNVRLFAMQLSDCRRMPLQQELNVACRLVANCDPVATFS